MKAGVLGGSAVVDQIPVIWVEPKIRRTKARLALWLPPLTMSKETTLPFLRRVAQAGCVAVSLDPWQHGQRGSETASALAKRVFGNYRRHMWPILGQTTLDCMRVVDWAIHTLGAGPEVVAGGVSMGGDIAVAFAGIDPRVSRVATIVATPDWARPGMTQLDHPTKILSQGSADAYAQWFYDLLDPITHPEHYSRGPAMAFECAGEDSHVPPSGALRFQSILQTGRRNAGISIRVTVNPGLGHLSAGRDPRLLDNCLEWLERPS